MRSNAQLTEPTVQKLQKMLHESGAASFLHDCLLLFLRFQ